MNVGGKLAMGGSLSIHVDRAERAPLSWHIRNRTRWAYIKGWIGAFLATYLSRFFGIPTMVGTLEICLNKADGRKIAYGIVSRRVVTTAFVNFVVDQLQTETSVFGDFKFHDSGVGSTAENITDTGIETTDGESRSTGTQTESASNAYRSVGTIAYTSTKSIVEHGLFNDASAGTLMDRSVFSVVSVVSGDSITFTYTLTLTAGS